MTIVTRKHAIPGAWRGLLAGWLIGLGGCGGGSNSATGSMMPPPPPPQDAPPPGPAVDPQYRASAASPFAAGCDGTSAVGTAFANAEVEPSLAIDPINPQRLAAVWQQDRWSTGGARAIMSAASADGGQTWTQIAMKFTRCGGGSAGNGGDYERASNPWITAAPDGTLHQLALAFDGAVLQSGSVSAVLAARSTDGGTTWGPTQTLVRDVDAFFNDKGAITADPITPGFVYAVWDRLTADNTGPTVFARSTDGGTSWEPARAIYDPGVNKQTISNAIVVLPNGILIDMYLEVDSGSNNSFASFGALIRSMDNGATWSQPVRIADNFSVGTRDTKNGKPVRDSALIPEIAVGPGGGLYYVWQDGRFSGGNHDGIALAYSGDGGLTWSAPLEINGAPDVAAFSPSVHVRADGEIGVTYYDFRSDTSAAATLYTDYWLARSSDGVHWHETQVADPFDLALAPLTTSPAPGGYFLGDYQALLSVGQVFMPMFVRTNNGNPGDPTDVYFAPALSATTAAAFTAYSAPHHQPTDELRRRVSDNIVRAMQARMSGWRER